jgi:uridine kinase
MITSERIAKKTVEEIQAWKEDHAKVVVGIDGYAGSGKTTVGNCIAEHDADVLTVHLDDFIKHWRERQKMIEEAEDKSQIFEHDWYRYDALMELITAFKEGKEVISVKLYDFDTNGFTSPHTFDLRKRVLIIDGIFLFHPEHKESTMIDKKIYLDKDFEVADQKRRAREQERFGDDYLPDDHPDNWFQYYKKAYMRYIEKYSPKGKADLVFEV